jgi:hypothetical protein
MQPQLRLSCLVGKLRHLRGQNHPYCVQPRRRRIAPRSCCAPVARRPRRLRSPGGCNGGGSGASRLVQQAKHLKGTSQSHHRRPMERRLRGGRGWWTGWMMGSCNAPAGKCDLCERAVHRLERRVAILRRRARFRVTLASHPRSRLCMHRYGRCGRLMHGRVLHCRLLLLLLLFRFNITQGPRLRISARHLRGCRRVDAAHWQLFCELRHACTLHGIIASHYSLRRRPWPRSRRRRRRRRRGG